MRSANVGAAAGLLGERRTLHSSKVIIYSPALAATLARPARPCLTTLTALLKQETTRCARDHEFLACSDDQYPDGGIRRSDVHIS